MTTSLPAGIESYLKEAGFSATEMLIIRKLVEEDCLTLRELAGKTGKSTGVLDLAMKKLLQKKIIRKDNISDHPKYCIHSLQSIVSWVNEDMKTRKETLERRHKNFEEFIASLKVDKARPDMEYFQGLEGIQKAYLKLLETGGELLTTTPITTTIEEDPLRAFRVDYFRKRQVRKIFQRILTPSTQLSRRFQSRDPFEYRRTLFLPESTPDPVFERTVVGSTVACIDFANQTACFIRYPDLAEAERKAFEAVWASCLKAEKEVSVSVVELPTDVPLKTRFFSRFREFILSKQSIAMLVLFALISGALTFGLYKSNREMNLKRLKDKVISIATTGALQFDTKDIDAIWKPEDIDKSEYAKLIATLNLIRRSNSDIQYAYIMRKTNDQHKMAFVADADSLYPKLKKDLNADGKIDAADALSMPGDLYDDIMRPYLREGLQHPIVGIGKDQWGDFISGQAPIRSLDGNAIAIIGVDMWASNLDKLSAQSFSPVLVFFGLFLIFALIRFAALNRSLLSECCSFFWLRKRYAFLWVTFILLLIISLAYAFQIYTYNILVEQTGERLKAIALTATDQFDPADLNQLHWARDMKTDAYQRVFRTLNEIRNANPDITFAYFVRPTKDPNLFEFVADSDANYNLPSYVKSNIDDISSFNEADENAWPGEIYDDSQNHVFLRATIQPAFTIILQDQWGSAISGCAPIFEKNREVVAILCFDKDLSKIGKI